MPSGYRNQVQGIGRRAAEYRCLAFPNRVQSANAIHPATRNYFYASRYQRFMGCPKSDERAVRKCQKCGVMGGNVGRVEDVLPTI